MFDSRLRKCWLQNIEPRKENNVYEINLSRTQGKYDTSLIKFKDWPPSHTQLVSAVHGPELLMTRLVPGTKGGNTRKEYEEGMTKKMLEAGGG